MRCKLFSILSLFLLISLLVLCSTTQRIAAADKSLTVVGLYSETSDGYASYRIGEGKWVVIKVGDKIPANAEIGITVDRDWVEVISSDNPNAVYEVNGSAGVPVNKKVADLLKEKPKTVRFPKAGDKTDPNFTNKLVVKQYLGRQVYQKDNKSRRQDIKYGDILEATGIVNIIAINNTLTLVLPDGKLSDPVVGPIRFTIEDVLKKKKIYKYMNVTK